MDRWMDANSAHMFPQNWDVFKSGSINKAQHGGLASYIENDVHRIFPRFNTATLLVRKKEKPRASLVFAGRA